MSNTKIKDYMGCEIFVTGAGKFWASRGEAEAVGMKSSLRQVELELEKAAMPAETFPAVIYDFPYRESFTARPPRISNLTITKIIKPRSNAYNKSYKFGASMPGRGEVEISSDVYKPDAEIAARIDNLAALCEVFNAKALELYQPIVDELNALRLLCETTKIKPSDFVK